MPRRVVGEVAPNLLRGEFEFLIGRDVGFLHDEPAIVPAVDCTEEDRHLELER